MTPLPLILDVYRVTDGGLVHVQRISLDAESYTIGRSSDSSIRLDGPEVSREHAVIEVSADVVTVMDRNSSRGTRIGPHVIDHVEWDLSQPLVLPGFEIHHVVDDDQPTFDAAPASEGAPAPAPPPIEEVQFSRIVGIGDVQKEQRQRSFPYNVFTSPVVSVAALRGSGFLLGECEYLALGAGIGSFVWIDHLRCYGVPTSAIRTIGIDPVPYGNYERYCRNSQIPRHERLRSNSISAPDNIWGFPGYASRETWRGVSRGKLGELKHIFDVFGEPAIAISYTPTAGDVFESVAVEAKRIGWKDMYLQGRIIAMRRTDDGRFAVAYRIPADVPTSARRENIVIGRFVHISTGYPATRFTQDLQNFRARHANDRNLVVNAYDPHDDLYFEVERSGRPETVIVRGRGIVASRVIQRLAEARARNPQIRIVHQMRSRVPHGSGSKFGWASRPVINDVEHQPFNWPKSCWGGELRQLIEKAQPNERAKILGVLGGTTTAERDDWIRIPQNGTRENWYAKIFGNIRSMEPSGPPGDRKVRAVIQDDAGASQTIEGDYIVDCTGLVADVRESPFLKDLLDTYQLRRNNVSGNSAEQRLTGLTVTNDFEIDGLRNGDGRVYAAGTITQNGPYAAVDSFLGLQYAALRSVDHLGAIGAPDVSRFGPITSFVQWLRWCRGVEP